MPPEYIYSTLLIPDPTGAGFPHPELLMGVVVICPPVTGIESVVNVAGCEAQPVRKSRHARSRMMPL